MFTSQVFFVDIIMFVLAELKQPVQVKAVDFSKDFNTVIERELNRKLANKVVPGVGLCIAVFDILEMGDSYVLPGDGAAAHTSVKFRMIVFRPALEEILVGTVKACTQEGVAVSVRLFDDIFIPAANLPHPSRFEPGEQLWVWDYATDDGVHKLFVDLGEPIRFRVTKEVFTDTSPTQPVVPEEGQAGTSSNFEAKPEVPYRIEGSTNEIGLGMVSWWGGT